ncbi:MAG TPA: multiheme c-type cytochrome [Burkholderiales bacterium]|nr:multiheme c-type cytochrome [Burkholderiales bacterium]
MKTTTRLLLAAWTAAFAAAATGASVLPHHAPQQSVGAGSCASSMCHGAIQPWKDSKVLQNEYVIWSRNDKHARAYSVLLNARSKEIARKLGMRQAPQEAAVCLDCHAHNPQPARRDERFVVSDGVSCEACHGPAGGWLKSHVEPKATHAGNIANGLYPADDDVARARLCLSCHLGTEQKFVTHKMMAAGHPRMSFELDTFTEMGPKHVRIEAERHKQRDGARAWAIGQAVAAEQLLGLLRNPQRGRDGLFPELVLFDCHSCHHAMGDKRNTAARVEAGPGVVRLNDAALLMLRQVARRVDPGGAQGFAQQVTRLHQAVGGGDDALEQARVLQEMVAAMLPRIQAHRFTAADLRGMMLGLIDDGLAGQFADYQGAEQATMAMQGMIDFLRRQGELRSPAVRRAMTNLLATVARDEKYQPATFEQALRELRAEVEKGMRK